jgi:hypothetical protein
VAKKRQVDEFAIHEVLHMSNFLAECVDRELVEHDAVKSNPEWRRKAEIACDALAELYQMIGAKALAR